MRVPLVVFSLCFALAFPPLASAAKLRVYNDPTFDFSTLTSYTWRAHPEMEQDENAQAIAGQIVMSEGNRLLLSRGYQFVDDSPDFYITYFVKGEQQKKATGLSTSWDYGPRMPWNGYSETVYSEFIDGTLVIDIVNAETNNLVWRAFYQDKVRDWKKRHNVIIRAVRNSLKKFPPKSSR